MTTTFNTRHALRRHPRPGVQRPGSGQSVRRGHLGVGHRRLGQQRHRHHHRANALIFGAGITSGGFSAAGTNFTTRIITNPDGDIAEDRIVTSAGPYSATAPVSGSWVMQVAAFKPAGAGGGDTAPPTAAITAPPPGPPSRAR